MRTKLERTSTASIRWNRRKSSALIKKSTTRRKYYSTMENLKVSSSYLQCWPETNLKKLRNKMNKKKESVAKVASPSNLITNNSKKLSRSARRSLKISYKVMKITKIGQATLTSSETVRNPLRVQLNIQWWAIKIVKILVSRCIEEAKTMHQRKSMLKVPLETISKL